MASWGGGVMIDRWKKDKVVPIPVMYSLSLRSVHFRLSVWVECWLVLKF